VRPARVPLLSSLMAPNVVPAEPIIKHVFEACRTRGCRRDRVDSSEMRAKRAFVASLKMRACGVPI
jgi:hypothetical protein